MALRDRYAAETWLRIESSKIELARLRQEQAEFQDFFERANKSLWAIGGSERAAAPSEAKLPAPDLHNSRLSKSENCRKLAEENRAFAARLRSAKAKKALLEIAGHYEVLAKAYASSESPEGDHSGALS